MRWLYQLLCWHPKRRWSMVNTGNNRYDVLCIRCGKDLGQHTLDLGGF